MTTLRDLCNSISGQLTAQMKSPPADPFDTNAFPFGVAAGNNKFGTHECATCGKPATDTGSNDRPYAFMFRNGSSAREYRISGMCQTCQDDIFGVDVYDR